MKHHDPSPAKRKIQRRMCEGKERYRDHAHAVVAARFAGQKRGVKLRTYDCPFCSGWHLTKKEAPDA